MSQTVSATPGAWEIKAQWPGNVATYAGISCYAENQGVQYIYSLEQDTTSPYVIGSMYRYKIASDNWESMGAAPIQMVTGGMVWTGGDNIYIMAGGSSAQNLFYRYTISNNSWTPLTTTGTSALSGSGLAWDGGDNIYASIRSTAPSNNDLWVYSISGGTWTDLIALPSPAASGSNLCKVGDNLYYGLGGSTSYYRYKIANNTWETLASVPSAGGSWGAGSGQEKVNENIIYADLGRITTNFYRFIIRDNRWDTMETLPLTVSSAGDRLAFDGTYLYMIRGYTDDSFWRYEVAKYFEKYCMPDFGQHSVNWCWVAAAANSIYWYSQHGYLQLIDDPAVLPENDNAYINQMVPAPDGHLTYRLFWEIASDCGHMWNEGVLDNEYFYGLQKFMNDQGVPLFVHEIVDPAQVFSPPLPSENVIYRPPTLIDYESALGNCQDVLLWLSYRHENYENYYRNEDTDHVVTGVAFNDNSWILVSDPWTTGSPDHNNDNENKLYDNLMVLSTPESPLVVRYAGFPENVSKIVYVSPIPPTAPPAPVENFVKENMPDLGQHCENWCWAAAASNSFKWYFHNGYPKLMDDPRDNVLDENYLQLFPNPYIPGDSLLRLLNEIAIDCLYPNVPQENEITITLPMTYCHPIDDNRFFLGLQKFIKEQGGQFKVREIIDNSHFVAHSENIPPENDNVVIYAKPTFDNYKSELKQCHDVLLQLDFRNYNYETGNLEGLDHIVTGVSYFDGGPGNQLIQVSDPWTPFLAGPDRNNLENLYENRYDNLQVVTDDPLTVSYTGWTPGGPMPFTVQVVKLIFISPENVSAGASVKLVKGWNLVGFTAVGAMDNPDNLFPGLTYLTNYRLIYWRAPGGPYVTQGETSLLLDNTGYWVWIDENYTVTTSGTRPTSRTENMKAGWNLVCFPVVNATTTPHNVFPGLTYLDNYRLIYWVAPGGPYKTLGEYTVLLDNTGYWVQIDENFTITVPA